MQEMQNFFRRMIQQTRDALNRLWQRRSNATDAFKSSQTWQRLTASGTNAWQQRSGLSYQALVQYGELVAAVRFLSVLPMPGRAHAVQPDETSPDPIVGSGYFSLVGALLALLLALWALFLGASLHLPSLMLAVLVLIVLVLLTGGLHLDGLMDSCDGLFGGTSREHKLEIMRDSRVGSFAVLGGACALLFKFVAFATLADLGTYQLPLALLIALPAARWAMVLVVYIFPSARVTGLGPVFRQTVTVRRLVLAALIALIIALLAGRLLGLLALLGATLAALLVGLLATRVLGGLTGDVYGAVEEVSEMAALLVLVLLRTWL
jgi:adenosylcobinamide-GDP ribazoletransferase